MFWILSFEFWISWYFGFGILTPRLAPFLAPSAKAISYQFSADTRLSGNQIHDLPYTGISIGYRWDSSATSQRRCLVEYNHIHNVMQELADGAGIYTLGYQPGTILRGNYIHDVLRSSSAVGSPNNGLYFDEGSKGFLVEDNLVYAVSGEPVFFNKSNRDLHQWNHNYFSKEKPPETKEVQEIIRRAGPDTSHRQSE